MGLIRTLFFGKLFLGCLCVLCFGSGFASVALAERMVTDLSRHTIEITSEFSGTELLIFGAIEREIILEDGGHGVDIEGMDYDIIVVVQSARHDMIVRRKEQIGPIWANKDFYTLKNVQGYYAVTTTRPLHQILSEEHLGRLEAGIEYLKVEFKEQLSEAVEKDFRDGFIRNMKARKLYTQQEGMISVLDDILFRAILEFPANMPVGEYQVDVHLIRDGELLLSEQSPLEVGKAGIERIIYMFAHDHPAYYGIMAIIVALFAGWLGGFLSRKMSG
ncbi:MAG: TIGR02186 family protein [Emcibacter sp.]|nr:TIGR02186 family protein [Emcibacter sp.]